jgi:hypothetical protein
MNRDESKIYDVRIRERNIRKGLVSRKDIEKYLKGLPDKADSLAFTRITDDDEG